MLAATVYGLTYWLLFVLGVQAIVGPANGAVFVAQVGKGGHVSPMRSSQDRTQPNIRFCRKSCVAAPSSGGSSIRDGVRRVAGTLKIPGAVNISFSASAT